MKKLIKIFALVVMAAMAFCVAACQLGGSGVVTAYDIAVRNGFKGTEQEWLESLKGRDGQNAQVVYTSLYDEAVQKYGFTGTFDEFVAKYITDYINNERENTVDKIADKAVFSTVSIVSTFSQSIKSWRGIVSINDYQAAGSGVITELDGRGNGYIVTNFHVIYSSDDDDGYADKVEVFLFGSEIQSLAIEAQIIGATSTYDLAVLKVTGSDILKNSNATAATFGDSNAVSAGDTVMVIGNAAAEGIAVTAGVVSVDSEYIQISSPRDGRTTAEYRVMRVDAAINGGNSGGGLYDLEGKLIGVVNAKDISASTDNMGYVIPSSIVEKAYRNILRYCNATNKSGARYLVGITLAVKDSYAYYDPVIMETKIIQTISVSEVASDGAAAGKLMAGDVIKSFPYEGVTVIVERMFNLTDYTLVFEFGKTATFTVERDGATIEVPVTFTKRTTLL